MLQDLVGILQDSCNTKIVVQESCRNNNCLQDLARLTLERMLFLPIPAERGQRKKAPKVASDLFPISVVPVIQKYN